MTATTLRLRASGALEALDPGTLAVLLERSTSSDPEVRATVAAILADVRARGDEALRDLSRRFDPAVPDPLEVPLHACDAALARTGPALRNAMERSAANLRTVHAAFRPREERIEVAPGLVLARRPDPLGRVGIYAPGGTAAYPSSVLMGAIPARVAGVGEVVVCSPPGPGGRPAAEVLAAAALAGVDRVFSVGGAGAIAAMAYGTASVPRADRIVGPGNAWVAEAKLQVAGAVGIDAPAGPSELLVLADGSADAAFVARELLAQAEHDPRACAVALAFGPGADGLAVRVREALARAVVDAPRRATIEAALAQGGAILFATEAETALSFASRYAPEHLVLAGVDAAALLPDVRNAGTVFVGEAPSNALGDYLTGANHVLPTGGLARSYSGLSTGDFVRWTTWQAIGAAAAASLAGDAACFATAEGLPGHAAAAAAWEEAS